MFNWSIIFLLIALVAMPFSGKSEEAGVKVETNGGSIEIKAGTPPPPPDPKVIVVPNPHPQVVEKTTTVVQPQDRAGCSCSLDAGGPCR